MKRGFTFIDVLIGISLMLIVFLGIFGVYRLSLKVVAQSKARITATAIANQKLEEIRNLAYPKVKYAPEGEVIKTATSSDNKYTITTTIIPISDCFDGPRDPAVPECVSVPITDNCEDTDVDYKRVKVEVSWSAYSGGKVSLATDVVPETLAQECEEVSGTLSVSVVNANSGEVYFPKIEIIDPEITTTIATEQPDDGKSNFPLFPQQYKVKITAFNYSEQTYGKGDVYHFDGQEIVIAEPEKEHPLVKANGVFNVGFQMDELGSIKVKTLGTEAEGYPAIPNISFTIWGTKLIGKDSDGDPIYKYLHQDAADEFGEKLIPNLEFDSYYFSVSSTDYDLVETNPSQPVDLSPGENKIVKLILEPQNSLLVTVLDTSGSVPIFGASVHLSNPNYDQTRPTDEYGQAFFAPLEPATYDLEVNASGYLTHFQQILISEEEDKVIEVELTLT